MAEAMKGRYVRPYSSEYRAKVDAEQLRQLALQVAAELKPAVRRGPTLSEFGPVFISNSKADRQKHSTIVSKQSLLDVHLYPQLGSKHLSEITTADVQALKAKLTRHSPKTVNGVLSTLRKLLKVAVDLQAIDTMPACRIEAVKQLDPKVEFYDYEQFEQLVAGAALCSPMHRLLILLGGEAGLRAGELMGLNWEDFDVDFAVVTISRSTWQGVTAAPKGGRIRTIPMTERLRGALQEMPRPAFKRNTGRVFTRDDGTMAHGTLRTWTRHAEGAAGWAPHGKMQVLRHTFCSHLAMRGASLKAIQELAGHTTSRMTERYMHLAPSEKSRAIALLDEGRRASAPVAAKPPKSDQMTMTFSVGGDRSP